MVPSVNRGETVPREKTYTRTIAVRVTAEEWEFIEFAMSHDGHANPTAYLRQLMMQNRVALNLSWQQEKKRREAADAYKEAGRADKAEAETAEGGVILKYLPAQLSEDEVKKIVADAVAESGVTTPQQMGAVMKIVQPKVAGKADGGMVSSLVKAALGAN